MTYLWIRHAKNESTTFFHESASVLSSGFRLNGACLLEIAVGFIFWWTNSSLFRPVCRVLCCLVVSCVVWCCLVLPCLQRPLVLLYLILCCQALSCFVLCTVTHKPFTLKFSHHEFSLSYISLWVVKMAMQLDPVPVDTGSTKAPSNRSHLYHDNPHTDTFTHTTSPSSLTSTSTSIFVYSWQDSHRPLRGIKKTKSLFFYTGNERLEMDLWLIVGMHLARLQHGICHHGRWTYHDRLAFWSCEGSSLNEGH